MTNWCAVILTGYVFLAFFGCGELNSSLFDWTAFIVCGRSDPWLNFSSRYLKNHAIIIPLPLYILSTSELKICATINNWVLNYVDKWSWITTNLNAVEHSHYSSEPRPCQLRKSLTFDFVSSKKPSHFLYVLKMLIQHPEFIFDKGLWTFDVISCKHFVCVCLNPAVLWIFVCLLTIGSVSHLFKRRDVTS